MISAITQVLADLVKSRRTGEQVERELDQHFGNFEAEVQSHTGKTVRLELESIRARPQFRGKKVGEGIWAIESWDGFSKYDENRTKPTVRERIDAILKDNWITVVRFNIRDGGLKDMRPDGLSLQYNSTILGAREPGRQIKPVETSPVQPDKIKLKIRYEGSIGEYRQQLSEAVDTLRYIQQNMELEVLYYLIELLHQAQWDEPGSTWGKSEERAQKLGEYLAGREVDTDELADMVSNLKTEIESERESSEGGE